MKKLLAISTLALLAGCHSLDHYVQPFGNGVYRIDDGDAVKIANRYCARSGQTMQPVGKDGGWADRDIFEFRCVAKDGLTASDVQPKN